MKKQDTLLIQKYVKNLLDQDLLVLFLHYQRITDDVKLSTLNDCIWFFVLKAEKHERKLSQT